MNESTLRAFLDAELDDVHAGDVRRHVAECDDCARTLERQRENTAELSAALRLIDTEPPTDRAREAVRRRLGRAEAVRSDTTGATNGTPARGWLRAAVLVVGLGGLAAAALPGSPAPDWARRAWDGATAFFSGESTDAAAPAAARAIAEAGAADSPASVSITPVDDHVTVSIDRPAAGTRVRVRLSEDPDRVRATAPGSARFRTAAGRIDIAEAGPGTIVITLPRSLASAVVQVDGTPKVVKEGTDLRVVTPDADTADAAIEFPARP